MSNVMSCKKRCSKVINVSCLSRMWAEFDNCHALRFTKLIKGVEVSITIVDIVRICRIECVSPLIWCWHVFCWPSFWLAFIIHQI
nr:hypothetical protein Iba_chr10aCG5830 [Ipomoea batatas]